MQTIIKLIEKAADQLDEQLNMTDTKNKDHGSADQTRGMFLEMTMTEIRESLYTAIKKLQIIDRELY